MDIKYVVTAVAEESDGVWVRIAPVQRSKPLPTIADTLELREKEE